MVCARIKRTNSSDSDSFAAFALMCVLERSSKPFQTPPALNIRPKIVCRVSYFDDDILHRSVSFWSSVNSRQWSKEAKQEGKMSQDSAPNHKIPRKPLIGSPSLNSADLTLKLSSTAVTLDRSGDCESSWAKDLNQALAPSVASKYSETSCENGSGSDTGSQTDSGSNISQSTWTSKSSAFPKVGKASPTPSSSISACSHRSPLSAMRYSHTFLCFITTDSSQNGRKS
jgi:hypothetical protein